MPSDMNVKRPPPTFILAASTFCRDVPLRNCTRNDRGKLKFLGRRICCTMVFTGIVEETGSVVSLRNLDSEDGHVSLTVQADKAADGVFLGDSVSVNGTCLTVTENSDGQLTFGLAPETLRMTSLGLLGQGMLVNLERSMGAMGRFGGHVVQGHVDGVGEIISVDEEKDALWFRVKLDPKLLRLVVPKGYVAVDGVSLTACDVDDDSFTFMMIPFTQSKVVTAQKKTGDKVNIEVDITGKYIERMLRANLDARNLGSSSAYAKEGAKA